MKKSELKNALLAGKTLSQCFELREGQECEIVKKEIFSPSDEICYVPDIDLNELREYVAHPVMTEKAEETDEIIADILNCCYTGKDFIDLCGGDAKKAEELFYFCDWQHPSSAIGEGFFEEE